MNWPPFLMCMAFGILAAYAERAYFAGVVTSGLPMRSDEQFADDLRTHPRNIIRIVSTETALRLRSLATRQQSPLIERQRRIALMWIGLALGCFVWWAWLR